MADRPPDFDPGRWKDARWSRWSFRNTGAFLPTVSIAASPTPRPLTFQQNAVPEGWDRFLETTHATSAVLLEDGHVSAAWPAGAINDPHPHMLFSITKSVVGLAARMLIDAGVLRGADRAGALLPDLKASAFGDACLSDLLAMRDGVPFAEVYDDPDSDIHRYSDGYWRAAPGGARRRLAELPECLNVPGFRYRTPVVDVIGAMMSAATGQRLSRIIAELIWHPMGAAHEAHFVLDTAGVEIAGAGMNATASDLARLALLLIDDGAWNGRQVVAEGSVRALFAGGDQASFARGFPERPGWSYRDLWWHMGDGTIAALGVHGQRMIIDGTSRLALIRTGAQPHPDNRPFDPAHQALLNTLRAKGPASG